MGSDSVVHIRVKGYQMVSADNKVVLIKTTWISTMHTIQSQMRVTVKKIDSFLALWG